MAKGLTDPQLRMLAELSEPNQNPGNVWYFPQKDLRTLRVLARRGLAKAEEPTDSGLWRSYGYRITERGRAALKSNAAPKPISGGDVW